MNASSRFTPAAAALVALLSSCDGPSEPVAPPPALSTVSATAASHTEVLLGWVSPTADVHEFRVERATAGGTFVQVAVVPGNVLSYRDVGLTPSTAYQYRVRACGDGGCSPFTEASVTTLAVLAITTESLPDGVRGQPYSVGLSATGGTPGYTWTVLSGSLPAGLSLSVLGIISGVPETAQTAVFVVRVRSEDGQTASKELSLRIVEPATGNGLAIVTARVPPAIFDNPYNVALSARGGDGTYAWSVASGSLPPGLTLGAGGVFSGFPMSAGTFGFTVAVTSAGHTDQRAYTLEVILDQPTRFDVTTFEVSGVPASMRPHLTAAVARWQQVITGDLGGLQIPRSFFSSTFCGGFGELVNGTSVDDILVMIDISPIDGPGKILGQAAPCGLRNTSRLPFVGILTLDTDDLTPLVGTQNLTDIIFHEIGHILGFGTLWGGARQLIVEGGTSNPRFTGIEAMAEYGSLGGSGQVPVEGSGGVGTADAHWRESVFRTEIMTGFSERIGTAMPLSRVSIASMADLGYVVDVSRADPFTLPSLSGAPAPTPLEPLGYDVILPGPVRYLPETELRR